MHTVECLIYNDTEILIESTRFILMTKSSTVYIKWKPQLTTVDYSLTHHTTHILHIDNTLMMSLLIDFKGLPSNPRDLSLFSFPSEYGNL